MQLLLIDDDTELCALLTEFLAHEGYAAVCEHDGARGLERALHQQPDLVILDVMLPTMDGFQVLRKLREQSRVPILMLTARTEDVDRIVGLELGADDYLSKPFNPRELAARIRAILRRARPAAGDASPRIEISGVALDPRTREVAHEGEKVELTTLEFAILEILMHAAGRAVSRDELMEAIYNRQATAFDRSIDMHVSHLRRKLESGGRRLIKTVRGVGYQFIAGANEE